MNTPLYLTGESYCGRYIPNIAKYILDENKKMPAIIIPLKGIAIGDGWTDPVIGLETGNAAFHFGAISLNSRIIFESLNLKV